VGFDSGVLFAHFQVLFKSHLVTAIVTLELNFPRRRLSDKGLLLDQNDDIEEDWSSIHLWGHSLVIY